MNAQDKASVAIREAAADWVVRLSAPEVAPAERVDFAGWLRASPVHVKEYLRAEAAWYAMGAVTRADTSQVDELLQRPASNVLPLAVGRESSVARRSLQRRPMFLAIAAAVVLALSSVLALTFSDRFRTGTYSTGIGEMRHIVLPDGSTLELNTHSKIRVEFDASRRDIHLSQGEAFFAVVKDAKRPFRVMSDAVVVRAIGTQFSVYRKSGETVVTVVEGKVAVSPPAARDSKPAIPLELVAGHQVVVDVSSGILPVRAATVDTTRATSWREHRLIFDDRPLAEVLTEFNRYNRRQLVVEDAELAAQGISGVFDPDKPQGLVLFLVNKGGVKTRELSEDRILLLKAEGS